MVAIVGSGVNGKRKYACGPYPDIAIHSLTYVTVNEEKFHYFALNELKISFH
jgi:hypothetical protein